MSHIVIQVNNVGPGSYVLQMMYNHLLVGIIVTAFANPEPAKILKIRSRADFDIPKFWIGIIDASDECRSIGPPSAIVKVCEKLFQTGTGKVVFLFQNKNCPIQLFFSPVLITNGVW